MSDITYKKSDLRGWYSIFRGQKYVGEAKGKVELKKTLKYLREKELKKKLRKSRKLVKSNGFQSVGEVIRRLPQ